MWVYRSQVFFIFFMFSLTCSFFLTRFTKILFHIMLHFFYVHHGAKFYERFCVLLINLLTAHNFFFFTCYSRINTAIEYSLFSSSKSLSPLGRDRIAFYVIDKKGKPKAESGKRKVQSAKAESRKRKAESGAES